MLVPHQINLNSSKDDIMNSITDDERKKLNELESERGLILDRPCRYTPYHEPSLVLDDFLFLGDMQHAANQILLQQYKIKHILNVCDWGTDKNIQDNFNVTHIPLSDDCQENIKQHFDETNELLHGFYEKNEYCLVHCAAGISRSATIVLAYLMKYHHNTLKDAYTFLHDKRPQISPNKGFLLQLIRYENELIQSREIKPTDTTASIIKEENPIETLDEFQEKHKMDK
ncbi:unnamed protein product [Adineta steineri]|uniref:protein-tyrosine-phosphatase n=2 Tax=Adineta steineri TaxID=433720 RepID=A0A813ZG64_9BILA|nr:unnamed protein product [Adineta steineri]